METKVITPAIKGTIIALILIVIGLTIYFTGQTQNKVVGYIGIALYAGAVGWSCIYYAKQKEGNVTFGNVFADGFKTSAAATAIFLVYTFLAFKFIVPDMIGIAMDEARKGMSEKKNLTTEQIDQAMGLMQKFFIPFAIGGAVFVNYWLD